MVVLLLQRIAVVDVNRLLLSLVGERLLLFYLIVNPIELRKWTVQGGLRMGFFLIEKGLEPTELELLEVRFLTLLIITD